MKRRLLQCLQSLNEGNQYTSKETPIFPETEREIQIPAAEEVEKKKVELPSEIELSRVEFLEWLEESQKSGERVKTFHRRIISNSFSKELAEKGYQIETIRMYGTSMVKIKR